MIDLQLALIAVGSVVVGCLIVAVVIGAWIYCGTKPVDPHQDCSGRCSCVKTGETDT